MRKKSHNEKAALEQDIAQLKLQKDTKSNAYVDELRKQNATLLAQIDADTKKLMDATTRCEQLEEQYVLAKAQLTSQNETLHTTNATMKSKIGGMETELGRYKRDNIELSRKIVDMQSRCKDLESKSSQNAVVEREKNRLLASVQEKNHQYELLISENEMNKERSEQLKKEVNYNNNNINDINQISRN